jgi:multimeric flavodoxin WrbA
MTRTIVVINGSPRKDGTVAHLLDSVTAGVSSGCDIHRYNVNDMIIRPCTGCMKCRSTGTCILPHDDAHTFAEDIRSCRAVVIGTPVYWGNMSGQLKLLFDRIVPSLMGESPQGIPAALHRGKDAVIVTACTTPWPFSALCRQTGGAVRSLKEILCYAGFHIAGTLVVPGTKTCPNIPHQLLEKGRRLGKNLNRP